MPVNPNAYWANITKRKKKVFLLKSKFFIHEYHEDGFTLIEILVVILIIGILASIAIPVFLHQRQKANEASLRSDMKTMATAMETYYTEHPPEELTGVTQKGWASVALGNKGNFVGIPGMTTGYYENGVKPITISNGSAIGVVGSLLGKRVVGSYCLVGNAANTKYAANLTPPTGVSPWAYALYYDSIGGGLFEPENLPSDGACSNYKLRIEQGIVSGEVIG